ncbi:MAG: valyl-tRNA synthetase [Patescibacteria group bacterium]|nr:valyl-tRNA synthetase [Patescibacteria group bacterium]
MKLSKTYDPKKHEQKIYKLWEEKGAFKPKHRGNDQSYSIVMPPPNANANIHLGTALTLDLQDIAIRYNRLLGKSALYIPGADHAGFETQSVFEKHLALEGKSRFDFTREELYSQIWDFVAENKSMYETQFRLLGASCDWDSYTFTLDKKVVNRAYKTFKKMWDEGLIYRGERLVNFCTYHGTGFADIEVVHKEAKGHLWHIRYLLTDGSGEVIVATTRPETMLGDVAVAVHPNDERYKKLVGKTIKLPLTNREIPILADDFVDIEYGTGAVKITPAHDQNDFDMAERHDLPKISIINHEGLLTHEVPDAYAGVDVIAAREKVVNDLISLDLLVKREDISHNVGHCYKCGTVIEPLLREQWFINMKPLAQRAIKTLKNNEITFYPETKKDQLISYLEGLRDWNISRQIAWGIPIPAFVNNEDPDDWIFNESVDKETIEINGKTYHRDPDVFDTWFSSSSWPYATLEYPSGDNFAANYPLSLMETGGEILYPWVSRMIMLGLYVTDKIPFKAVYIHGYVMAEDGSKMSKSLGNVVNPIPVIEKYGSDALRMGLVSGRAPAINRGYDPRRVEEARNFCNKLWNIARFIQEQITDKAIADSPEPITPADHWILSKLQHITDKVSADLDNYAFAEAYEKIYHLVWDDFAAWYIEASKTTPNQSVLKFSLVSILKLCHPFAPFVTETIWQSLHWSSDLLITSSWPVIPKADTIHAKQFEQIKAIVTETRQLTKAMNLQKPTLAHSSDLIEENQDLLQRLAKLGSVKRTGESSGLKLNDTNQKAWLEISPEDLASYKDKLVEKLGSTETSIKGLDKRLQNKSYVANAPTKIIQQTRDQLEQAESTRKQIKEELSRFSS